MSFFRPGVSRKRSGPSESTGDCGPPVKRTRLNQAVSQITDLWQTFKRMADWLITPRAGFDDTYNYRRRDLGTSRPLTQGRLTDRYSGMTSRSNAGSVDSSSMTYQPSAPGSNSHFRFGASMSSRYLAPVNRSTNGQIDRSTNGPYQSMSDQIDRSVRSQSSGRRVEPSKDRRSEIITVDDYVGGGTRLFARSPRKHQNRPVGRTMDKVRGLQEKRLYEELLKTVANELTTNGTTSARRHIPQHRNKQRSGNAHVTSVDDVTWERVDDTSQVLMSSRDTTRTRPHVLKPSWSNDRLAAKFNNINNEPPTHSSPSNRRQVINRIDADSRCESTNQNGQSSANSDETMLGITSFVKRIRHGIQSKKPVDELFPDQSTTTTESSDVVEARSDDVSVTSQVDDVINLSSDEDDVQIELEEKTPTKRTSKKRESPDLVVELEEMTRVGQRRSRPVLIRDSPELVALDTAPASMTSSKSRDQLQRDLETNVYTKKSWLQLERQNSRDRTEAVMRSRAETEMEIKILKEERDKQIERIENSIRRSLRIADLTPAVIEEPEEEVEEEVRYPELSEDMDSLIDSALYHGPATEVLVDHKNIQIRRSDLQTLDGTTWLNDEVINFHMNLMIQRGEEEGRPKVHAFNTFFYQKIVGDGHSAVRRWTRKVDVFSKDYLVIPVHLQMHWCMAIVDFRKREIRYYDSMGGNNNTCLNAVKKYLEAESLDKKKQAYDTSDWKMINAKGPQQMNGSDCGVFSTICAEHVTRDAPLTYSQDLMPYFRRRMVYEIMTKRLMQ